MGKGREQQLNDASKLFDGLSGDGGPPAEVERTSYADSHEDPSGGPDTPWLTLMAGVVLGVIGGPLQSRPPMSAH